MREYASTVSVSNAGADTRAYPRAHAESDAPAAYPCADTTAAVSCGPLCHVRSHLPLI